MKPAVKSTKNENIKFAHVISVRILVRVSTDAGNAVTTAHLPHPTHDLAAQMHPEVSLPLGHRLKNLALFSFCFYIGHPCNTYNI